VAAARIQAEKRLASGEPRQKWDEMIVAQGAILPEFNRKLALNHTAPIVAELRSAERGYVSRCDARVIGEVIRDLGGGRMTRDSAINYDAGVELGAKPGESIAANSLLARVHASSPTQAEDGIARLKAAFDISPEAPVREPLIRETILPRGENE
jgi:thymidine phosphorylase